MEPRVTRSSSRRNSVVSSGINKNASTPAKKARIDPGRIEEEADREGVPNVSKANPQSSENMDVDLSEDEEMKREEGLFVQDPPNLVDEGPPPKEGGGPSAESRENTKAKKTVPKLDITIQVDDRTPTPPTPNEDDEDVLTAMQAFRQISLGKEDDDLIPIGWTPGPFGKALVVLQDGPKNAAKFRVRRAGDVKIAIHMDEKNNLKLNRAGEKMENGKRVVTEILAFQGVAWEYPNNDPCPILLLNPNNWPTRKNGRKCTPPTLVKVKMRLQDEIVTSWETRTTIRAIWGNNPTTLKDDLKIGDYILIPNAQSIGSADAAILATAVACEARHQEWCNKKREGKNSSPSPFPDVEGLRSTT